MRYTSKYDGQSFGYEEERDSYDAYFESCHEQDKKEAEEYEQYAREEYERKNFHQIPMVIVPKTMAQRGFLTITSQKGAKTYDLADYILHCVYCLS